MKKDRLELFHEQERVHVSRDDARLSDLEAVLGVNVFDLAITDLAEIKDRQEVFAFLLDNPLIFDQLFANWAEVGSCRVPTDSGEQFLFYYEMLLSKDTKFWFWTEKILKHLTGELPERIEQALEVVNQEKDDYFQEERDLAEA